MPTNFSEPFGAAHFAPKFASAKVFWPYDINLFNRATFGIVVGFAPATDGLTPSLIWIFSRCHTASAKFFLSAMQNSFCLSESAAHR
ncbi:hypothetical protein DLM45_01035 [Hyphomicrobium methylovorum]|nr:hypothetical protein [Hyphomicrobium methylovorum]